MKYIYKAIPYHQWNAGLWDDYEVYGYTFFGRCEVPHTVELRKLVENDEEKVDSTPSHLI